MKEIVPGEYEKKKDKFRLNFKEIILIKVISFEMIKEVCSHIMKMARRKNNLDWLCFKQAM